MKCFAFGYAGSSDRAFDSLAASWPASIGFEQLVYPGRGSRRTEKFATSLQQLAYQAADKIAGQREVILLGYSLGALIAFETAQILQRHGHPASALVVGAMNPPHRLRPSQRVHTMSQAELIAWMTQLGGTPPEILASPALVAWFAPIIQADYALLDSYRPLVLAPLSCPVVAMYGEQDTLTSRAEIAGWQEHTLAFCRCASFAGGHFFLHHTGTEIVSLITETLALRQHSDRRHTVSPQ